MVGPKQPRDISEIFDDLRKLAQSDGAIHSISKIIYRDWILTIDTHEAKITDDPSVRWSTDKLNNNELMLLVGLAIQSASDRTFSVLPASDDFAGQADRLLRELHDSINGAAPFINPDTGAEHDPAAFVGEVAREAIYYGADGFYAHQFLELSRHRFRNDQEWLQKSVGISIRGIIDIARHIQLLMIRQMDAEGHRRRGADVSPGDLTNSLVVIKADLIKKHGQKVHAFLAKFASPAVDGNAQFTSPFSVNQANIAPLVDLGDHLYVPSTYKLLQSVYESPFYWMFADPAYRDAASKHRGAYVEETGAHILRSVFGTENVHSNVKLYEGKDVGGEIDILVAYGEFLIVGQAKSKRVSMKARAGDKDALAADFKGAVQDPYEQAIECADLIRRGARCATPDGTELEFLAMPRLFPMVLLSDHFPAATQLSGILLKQTEGIAPVVWDLGFLDCAARVLSSPIEMIFYLQSRAQLFDKVISDSEYNFLGFHLRSKLAIPEDVDMMMLERDYATVVDDFMVAADLGIPAERPRGVLEQLDLPVITELFVELKRSDPRLAAVVVDLYDFSGAALADLSATVLDLREEIRATGKAFKAFSIQTGSGGLTYVVSSKRDDKTFRSAHLLGAKHKYDTKSDRWYVILDCVETPIPVDGLLPLIWPWQEDEGEADRSAEVARVFNSSWRERVVGEAAERRMAKSKSP